MSYIKKHWFELLVSFICLGLAIYFFCTAEFDMAVIWLLSSFIWLNGSMMSDDRERIELLEKKAEKYDALVEKVEAMREWQQTYEKLNEQRFKNLEERNESSRTLHS